MAISKLLVASLVISLLLNLAHSDSDTVGSNEFVQNEAKIDCGSACSARCRLASRQRLCNRACGTCCARCNCVPPGTSGNHHLCRCYATLTTHGGKLKCP